MTDREVVNMLIDAWESLPGGRYYSPHDVDRWLQEKMAPAIKAARKEIDRKEPTV